MIRTSPREAAGAAVLLLLLTATEGAGVLLLAPLLELVGAVEENPLPRAGGWITSGLGAIGVAPTLGAVLLLFVAITAVRAVVQRAQSVLTTSLRENLAEALRLRVYKAMVGAEWRFLVTRTPSDFMHVIITEVGRVGVAAGNLMDLLVALVVAAVYFALALRLSPEMAVLVLVSAVVLGWFVRGPLDQARTLSTTAARQRQRLHRAIVEHVGGVKVSKSYAVTARHEDVVVRLAGDSKAVTLQAAASDADFHRMLELGSTILLAFIVYASSALLNEPAALLLVMLFIFARLMPRLVAVYRHLQALASTLPVFEIVRQLERDCLAAAEPRVDSPADVTLTGSVRFDRVSFSYLGRETPAVADLDLEIKAGDTTAIVGASGSGKSTVADLLLGAAVADVRPDPGGRPAVDARRHGVVARADQLRAAGDVSL
ncbi:MAG: ABC transporter ATP-binding protein [Vicinamibacterales bacterium]|jgi:ATP-binding cassette subfamily C protein